MKRTTTTLFRILFVLYIAVVMYLCFGHFNNVPGVKWSYFGIPTDKIVHFCMFFPFPLLLNWAIGRRQEKWYAGTAVGVLIGALGFAIAALTEIGQDLLTSWRVGDVADFRADCLAILFSTVIVIIINLYRSHKK